MSQGALVLDFPTTQSAFDTTFNGGYSDAFVVRLSPTGSALTYATFLGGSGSVYDSGSGIAVDTSGAVYVTGYTGSADFPTTAGAVDTAFNGGTYDAFVAKLGLNSGDSNVDFSVVLIETDPYSPIAMSDSTIEVNIQNIGSDTYVPVTGEYALGVKLIDTDRDPDDYWYYRLVGSGIGTLPPNGVQTLYVRKFWFTRPQVDQIEVTLFPKDAESNATNNSLLKNVTVQPAPDSLLDCLSLLLDVVTVYAATHGISISALQKISVNFILTLAEGW